MSVGNIIYRTPRKKPCSCSVRDMIFSDVGEVAGNSGVDVRWFRPEGRLLVPPFGVMRARLGHKLRLELASVMTDLPGLAAAAPSPARNPLVVPLTPTSASGGR